LDSPVLVLTGNRQPLQLLGFCQLRLAGLLKRLEVQALGQVAVDSRLGHRLNLRCRSFGQIPR